MPPVPFKRIFLIKLINKLVEDLQFPYPLRIGDFGEERDLKKWLPFLSCLILFIENQSKLRFGEELLIEMRAAKITHANLLEVISVKEKQLEALHTERRAKQSTIDQLLRRVDELTIQVRETQKAAAEAEAQFDSMKAENFNAKKQCEALQNEILSIKEDFEACSKRRLRDIHSLPEMNAELQERLMSVEIEMHRAFEVRNSTMDQITGINRYEPLLDQLKEILAETEEWKTKYITVHQTEKEKLAELEQVKRELEEAQSEKCELTHAAMDLQNQMMRKKLLLANKKKGTQASKKSAMKEIDSINSDNSETQQSNNQLEQKCVLYEEQLKLEREGIAEMLPRLKEADKLGRLLCELRKEFSSV
ncbi:hypothetical protein FGIG_01824 [Fasciola gigantica]|uniref:Uncharacterized protein n=1 Tax=Fasciola gigantica TaxID=46835 RepID=A0A504YKL9_FASGI|nr:hypothetical protein FGIG_01824 [Fasciola gigantica]